ncbi:divalent-cation tolerance protein CutA [Parvularcula oceani]|uniref:divalent-cation tolerance protein CutA n=1 Tax=Parvularcula oceani TaxID=1247963 RepID=UPI0004E203BF|nr:divalent-cation tolerance protein CutA [Parvularcula oceani]
MKALVIVQTAVGSRKEAASLARRAVEARLAACVQTTPVFSTYRWEGAVTQEEEWRLDLKTTASLADRLVAWLAEAHPYDEPELIVLEVARASAGYAAWAEAETLSE